MLISRMKPQRDVYLIFQPGEETGEAVRYETRFREERAGAAETVREFSRLCERDARRYDGGFPFY